MAGRNAAVKMCAALGAAIVVTLALALGTAARAATITVDSLADTGTPGICVLRDAITAANTMTATNGCAAGTGNDTINFSVTGTIALASTLPQVTDSNLTISGPTSPGITIDGGGEVQIMQVALRARLSLTHLTIAHGFGSFSAGNSGGGIYNEGMLTITNSTFAGNRASPNGFFSDGGGVYNNRHGRLTIASSIFSHNRASASGGGIYNGGTLTITNSTFSGNSAGNSGGGIAGGATTITNSTFAGNSAGNEGGGIAGGTLITNSTFAGNSANRGGGIAGGTLITNSTFFGNRAFEDGASIVNFETLTVTNSTFSGNRASLSGFFSGGGGISNYGTLTVTNSTFAGNRAFLGGAIDTEGESGVTYLKSTVMAANRPNNCLNDSPLSDAGYNISDDFSCGFKTTSSQNNTDPMLDPVGLTNNGGPTQTIALLSGSPAIDAIPLADCTDQASPPNPIITDQRLFPRPDADEHRCDIGAYEFADAPFVAFSRFHGHLTIRANQTVFDLGGRFKLGTGGSIDPTTQPVEFSVGSYAIRLPVDSFVNYNSGYIYQKRVNGIFLWLFIKFSGTPDTYILRAYRRGGTVPDSGSPVSVTLTIGDNSGSTQMNIKFD